MRLKILACKILFRELSALAAHCENIIDVTYLKQDFHNTPELLQAQLQAEIDKLDNAQDPYTGSFDFNAILLGYGLCSNAVVGLVSQKYPIVIPKAHDCISLFLGSREKYKCYFDTHQGGIYWYSRSWIESTPMPSKERYDHTYKHYLEKYGEDNAQYLMEMEQDWLVKYNTCAFVDWQSFDTQHAKDYTKACADYLGWQYEELQGSDALLKNLLDGNWSSHDFLVIPPQKTIAPSYDESVVKIAE